MKRHPNLIATAITAIIAIPLLALFAFGVTAGSGADNDSTGASGSGSQQAVQAPSEADVTIDVEIGEMYIEPKVINVEPGATVAFRVTNAGVAQHDFNVNGEKGTALLDPGATETFVFGPMDESLMAWCTVPGHKAAGMVADIVVGDDGSSGTPAQSASNTAEDNFATIDPNAEPDAEWKPFDPVLQPAPGATNHEIDMEAGETVIEVAPGVTQEMWTFDGQVPGPILRGKVGDIFTINLTNTGKVGHSIDFHSSKVAWNDEMRTINPGESLTYQFEAKHSGIFMFHCGTAPALHHIGNGMFGAIIIDPPSLPAVDHEFVFVQSELYLGPEGQPGDLQKMVDEDFDAVVFNGYFNQYAHAPIRVETGERIRAWVLDAGPSENSSFHIVGTIFDTMFKEGVLLLQPDETRGGAQALDLQPAQGGYVEFTFDEDGLYPIVTHKFSNVGKGALGLFQAGEVEAAGNAGH